MGLGESLFGARKRTGLSQEDVAQKLGVSRQTVSKWETNESLPDIYQSKKMAMLYNISLDELIGFDIELKEIENIIENTSDEIQKKINWTKVWSKKYPILNEYQDEVNIDFYAVKIKALLYSLKKEYGYSDLDACLVLKDILAHVWNNQSK